MNGAARNGAVRFFPGTLVDEVSVQRLLAVLLVLIAGAGCSRPTVIIVNDPGRAVTCKADPAVADGAAVVRTSLR